MNHWKRTMGTLCLTGLLCLSLAACGGKAPTASKSPRPAARHLGAGRRSGLDHLGHHQRPKDSHPDGGGKGSLCLHL